MPDSYERGRTLAELAMTLGFALTFTILSLE